MTTISTTRAVERCQLLAALGPVPAWWRVFALRRWLRAYRAIMALDISVGAQMLREVYPADWVEKMANQPNNTFLGIVKAEASEPAIRWIDTVDQLHAERSAPGQLIKTATEHEREPPPVDRVIRLTTPHVDLTKGQAAMAKGEETVWQEIEDWILAAGVPVRQRAELTCEHPGYNGMANLGE